MVPVTWDVHVLWIQSPRVARIPEPSGELDAVCTAVAVTSSACLKVRDAHPVLLSQQIQKCDVAGYQVIHRVELLCSVFRGPPVASNVS